MQYIKPEIIHKFDNYIANNITTITKEQMFQIELFKIYTVKYNRLPTEPDVIARMKDIIPIVNKIVEDVD